MNLIILGGLLLCLCGAFYAERLPYGSTKRNIIMFFVIVISLALAIIWTPMPA